MILSIYFFTPYLFREIQIAIQSATDSTITSGDCPFDNTLLVGEWQILTGADDTTDGTFGDSALVTACVKGV